jgi:xanthine dehydrogenase accessory factor
MKCREDKLRGLTHAVNQPSKICWTLKRSDYKRFTQIPEDRDVMVYLEPVLPPPHLIIAGAGHIGKALTHLGKLLDFEVTVIDQRAEYANRANIPDADHLVADDIGQAMQKLKKTPDTYIVIVTHGHKHDADALRACIGSGAAYVGMIGSRKKISLMRKNSIEEKWATPRQWEQIHAPIGLPIRSESEQEIAIRIAAQLVLVRNSKIHAYD